MQRLSTYGFAKRFVAPPNPRIGQILELPMVKTILDRIDENPGAIFIIQGAPQIFKTLIGQLVGLRSMLIEPVPSLWYGKNEKTAVELADEKFNPLFDSSMPTIRVKLPDRRSEEAFIALLFYDRFKRTGTRYTLPRGETFLFLSAGVDINRQSKSATNIFLDEPWEYEPGWIKEIQRRRGDAQNFREIHMQTGPSAGSYSAELFDQSTQEVWHMRCTTPTCRKLIAPEFGDGKTAGGIKFESGPSVRDADGVRLATPTLASVRLECPHCGTLYEDTPHARTALSAGGCFVAMNGNAMPNIHGFRLPHIVFRSWGEAVWEKIIATRALRRGDMSLLEDFVRKVEVKTWSEEQHLSGPKLRPVGKYKMGDEWADEMKDAAGRPWRIATIDVQQDYYVLTIRMWAKFSRSRLRWTSKPLSESEINETLTAHQVIRERVFLDGRFEPTRVRRMALRNGWKVFMGDKAQRDYLHQHDGVRRIYDEAKYIDAFAGTVDQGRMGRVIEILFSKQSALNRLHLLRTEQCQPDPMDPTIIEPIWTAAQDAPEWYWREIDAHYRVKEDAKDGTQRWVWKGFKEDHAGDCEAMNIVAASIAGLTGAESLESPEPPPPQEKKE